MNKKPLLIMAAGTLIAAGVAYAQFPIMDKVADKVIQKYQTSSCEQLWQQKAQGQGQPTVGGLNLRLHFNGLPKRVLRPRSVVPARAAKR